MNFFRLTGRASHWPIALARQYHRHFYSTLRVEVKVFRSYVHAAESNGQRGCFRGYRGAGLKSFKHGLLLQMEGSSALVGFPEVLRFFPPPRRLAATTPSCLFGNNGIRLFGSMNNGVNQEIRDPNVVAADNSQLVKLENRVMRRLIAGIAGIAIALYLFYRCQDVDFFAYSIATKFMLRVLPPEAAHQLVLSLGSLGLLPVELAVDDPALRTRIGDLRFPSVIGLAAGFDKNAVAIDALMRMGFGFVEIGTVTPEPQAGNVPPRLFRLLEDKAIINRMGFNNDGCQRVKSRLEKFSISRWANPFTSSSVLGVNIGKNKHTEHAASDIKTCIRELAPYADYITINVSSPNTPNLRELQRRSALKEVIMIAQDTLREMQAPTTAKLSTQPDKGSLMSLNEEDFMTKTKKRPLLFVKIAPDVSESELKDIAEVALETSIDGLIVSNTTVSRPCDLKSAHSVEIGGLSGAPLKDLSTEKVSQAYKMMKGDIPIIAVGGIFSGMDALEKIEAGATLVQIYTGMIYEGPVVAHRVKDELSYLLYKKGYTSISDAVGVNHRTSKPKKVKAPSFS